MTTPSNAVPFGRRLRISYTLMTILVWQAVVLTAILWASVPQTVPVQFSITGAITATGDKSVLILLCGINIGLYIMHMVLMNTVPKKTGPGHMFGIALSARAREDDINRGREIIVSLLTAIDAIIAVMLDVVIICTLYALPTGPVLPIAVVLAVLAIAWYEHRMKAVRTELEARVADKREQLKD